MIRKAKVLGSAPSKTYPAVKVRCACGKVSTVYQRSWAGNGFKVCVGCKRRIIHDTLRVVDAGRATKRKKAA